MKKILLISTAIVFISLSVACGGGSGGDSTTTSTGTSGALRALIDGFISFSSGAKTPVTVSALGASSTTDGDGNYQLAVDGSTFAGGPVEFTLTGTGISETVVLSNVAGGAGGQAFVDFVFNDSGRLSAESRDTGGNVLASSGLANCSTTSTFVDGGQGALWKPHSERTGTVVILMPAEYRNADVQILNSQGDAVASPLIRDCCDHNGGREHIYLTETSGNLAASNPPLTVVFTFPSGVVDCRTVPNPADRYD